MFQASVRRGLAVLLTFAGAAVICPPVFAGVPEQVLYVGNDNAAAQILQYDLPLSPASSPNLTFHADKNVVSLAANPGGTQLAVGELSGQLQIFTAPFSNASAPSVTFANGSASNNGQNAFLASGGLGAATVSNRANLFSSPFSNASIPSGYVTDPSAVSLIGLALDSSQNLYVGNAGTGDASACTGTSQSSGGCGSDLLVYAPPYTGAPIVTPNVINFPYTGNSTAYRKLAVGATRLYAASVANGTGRVDAYNLPITASSVPAFALTTGINTPEAVALDTAGNLYIGNLADATVTVYSAPITASSVPSLIFKVSSGAFALFGMTVANANVLSAGCSDLPALATPHNTALTIALNCSDPDPLDTITYSVVTQPSHGTVSAPTSGGQLTYTPAAGYSGPDSFTYKATDEHGLDSNIASAALTVGPSAPPNCANRSLSVAGMPGALNLGCTHVSADTLHWAILSNPNHGQLGPIGQDGGITYTPAKGYGGPDAFTFTATDVNTGVTSSPANVAINVVNVPCSGLTGEKLAVCRAALTRDQALKICSSLKASKRSRCVAAANLAYRRAVARAHCQTLSGHRKATCIQAVKKLR